MNEPAVPLEVVLMLLGVPLSLVGLLSLTGFI